MSQPTYLYFTKGTDGLTEVTTTNPFPVAIGETNIINTKVKPFEVSVEITRPENQTQYAIGDIINNGADTTLPALNLSSIASAGQTVQIVSAILTSSNGAAATKLSAQVHLWNINNIQADCTDNLALAPTYAVCKSNRVAMLDDLSTAVSMGENAYSLMQSEMSRLAVLDANAKLYASIIAANAYTPASAETITLKIKGYLL